MKSVIQNNCEMCYLCGTTQGLEHHHIFGASYKKKSEKYGFIIRLCSEHHRGSPFGIHHNISFSRLVKSIAQEFYEENIGSREDWLKDFGRNYCE